MRCGILVLFLGLLSIDFLIVQVQSILDGGHANWRQYGFLVKVFARNKNADVMKSCLGTLISNNVVITSASCIMNEKTKVS
jgi:secreted trypsin-like serine protease